MFLTVVVALSLATAYAGNEGLNGADGANAYVMEVGIDRLARFLGLTPEQAAAVEGIHSGFCADMSNAAGADASERGFLVRNAVARDLANMRLVLTKEQYRDYLRALNETFRNRGIDWH